MLDEAAVGYRIVLTKSDKVRSEELAETLAATEAVARKHIAAFPGVLVTSGGKTHGDCCALARCDSGRFRDLGSV